MEKYNLTQTGSEVQEILDGAAMQSEVTAEKERAELAEKALDLSLDAEQLAREQADQALQRNIDAEEIRAKAAEKQNADDIDDIEAKIPAGASDENPLTTKEYVDDSIATASATFRGTYNLVSDLHLQVTATHADIANALATAIATTDNNDYAFVQVPTSNDTPTEISKIERYKFNGTIWAFEYDLNNSGFTSDQWDAINSGITNSLVQKLLALPTNAALQTLLNGKQDALTFDSTPTQNSQNPVTSGGVYTGIHNEAEARKESDHTLEVAIQAILALIPSEATAANQLADKAFVNSSIATNTATFRGTFNLVSDLHLLVTATHGDIENALGNAISSVDNNDYCFVQIPTSNDTPTEIERIERYKYNGTVWLFEYELNNSGFTSAQWAAINSGITQQAITIINDRISTNEDDIAMLQAAYTALTQSDIIIVNGALPTSGQQLNKIYRQPDQDNNPPQYYRDYMWNGSAWVLMGQYDMNIDSLVGYYECDTAGATAAKVVTAAGYALPVTGGAMKIKMANRNTVANATLNINSTGAKPLFYNGQRAGVGNTWDTNEIVTVFYDGTNYQAYNVAGSNGDGVFDISTYNLTEGQPTPYADLAAALGTNGEHVPHSYRKGGMSVKFVQSSDNKYVQFRCKTQSFSAEPEDWYFCGDSTLIDNPEYIKAETDAEGHLLFWIKADGSVDWAIGVPKPVKDYVDSCIAEIRNGNEGTDLDGLNKIIAFLDDFSTSDTLASLLSTKVDKENGKSLIQSDVANNVEFIENSEWLNVDTDSEEKVLGGRKTDGTLVENVGFEATKITVKDYIKLSPAATEQLSEDLDNFGSKLCVEKQGDNITITNIESSNTIKFILKKNNPVVNYNGLVYNNHQMDMPDDVAPLHILNTTLGANHSQPCMKAHILSHGLVNTDIGTEWIGTDNRKFYIMKIVDSDNVLVLSENIGTMESPRFVRLSTGTLLKGNITLNVDSVELTQLWPGVKNQAIEIRTDSGKVIATDGRYYCKHVDIVESYDVMNPVSVLENIILEAGQDIEHTFNGDTAVSVENIYRTIGNLTVLTIATVVPKQRVAFENLMFALSAIIGSNGVVKYYVPNMLPYPNGGSTIDFSKPVAVTWNSSVNEIFTTAEYTRNQGTPINRVLQYDGVTFGLALGYFTDRGVGQSLFDYTTETFELRNNTGKVYPYGVNSDKVGNYLEIGQIYSAVMYRTYFVPEAEGNRLSMYHFNLNGSEYIFIDYSGSMLDHVNIEDQTLEGKVLTVLESENVVLKSSVYNNGFYLQSSYVEGESCYAVIKI